MCARFHGLRQGPKCGLLVVEPIANSCMLFLPTTIAPACFSRPVTVESSRGTASRQMRAPFVVSTPAVA
jgi:hypothetical protein